MEITVIHGQVHKGSTYHITEMLKNRISHDDTVVHEFYLPKDSPGFCVGCFQCIFKGEEYCPESEKVKRISEAMLRSQIIIVDSPTYCFEMTGQLKSLFDHFGYMWMSHRPQGEMFTKTGVVVTTAAGAGGKSVVQSIRRQLFWWGIPKIHSLKFNVNASSWDDVSEKIMKKIIQEVDETAFKIRRTSEKSRPGIKTWVLFNIMRKMHSSNTWNKVDKAHWENNLWLEKERPWKRQITS
ncbi:NAD(P)H-dependent oxidoreductase [Proteiniclasticum sp.]|uniref:flavodoxin family protein n=1 Tax=Proteiniclasticum sp. TaxID=2053595 RepID=UPI0028981794|nr:NAD(P)H-dependent oxidoreductase [Proteiniclasticum sp.]